ncbi:MAG: hypothetical protein K6W08_15050, partial [Firmicutes bacterium]|nr:hypothetical protein [Bacillota bacterium]
VDTTGTPTPQLGSAPRGGPLAWVGAFTGFYPAQAAEFAHLDPVTRFLYASRSVILRGAGWPELWLHASVLTGMAIAALVLGSLSVQRRL